MPTALRYLVPAASLLALLTLAACAPTARMVERPGEAALPRIPKSEGTLDIRVAYPHEGAPKPNADSTFIFGEVGTGRATLEINGQSVPVEPNGAFLAFVPVPEDGVYRLEAERRSASDVLTLSYATAAPSPSTPDTNPAPAPPKLETFATPVPGVVQTGRDTLATGSGTAYAAPTPTADRRWFFPLGTQLQVTGRQGGNLRVRLTDATEAWIDSSDVLLRPAAPPTVNPIGAPSVNPEAGYVDLKLPAAFSPFHINPQRQFVEVTIYRPNTGSSSAGSTATFPNDPFLEGGQWNTAAADSAVYTMLLEKPLWGFKAFYDAQGNLVVRLRRPPAIDPAQPLRGIRVMVDPGHPPGGAIGPTGLTEAEANLDISLRLARMLRERGAEVIMTRTTAEPIVSSTSAALELWARVDTAVIVDADVLVSVHNNAFPDGVNPFEHYGTETYYYHAFAEPLAQALLEEIVQVTGLPSLGAKQRSLALVRPSWVPSTLTESLFMMFPRQEAALRNDAFLDRLAAAHVSGIESFLRRQATP